MSDQIPEPGFVLSEKLYSVLKWVALVVLPVTGTLYFTVAQLWGLPNAEEVVGTIVAIGTALGAILGFSTRSYNKSELKYDGVVRPGTQEIVLNDRVGISDVPQKKELLLKVDNSQEAA